MRSAAQRTGRCKCSAATAQSGYSRYMKILVPNPPPTSGVTTRMRWGSTFRMCLARILRMSWLPWLPRVRVQRFVDASNSATQARGSRKLVTRRLLTRLSEITRCAASKALSVFLTVTDLRIEGCVARSLRPHARGSLRRRTLNPDGCVERLPVDRNGLRGRLASSSVSATTKATASPTCRTVSTASTDKAAPPCAIRRHCGSCRGTEGSRGRRDPHGSARGARRASSGPSPSPRMRKRACAWGLRTTTP